MLDSSFFFFNILRRMWSNNKKIKLKLTTLPRIFIHVVCRFNSIAFATSVSWLVLRFPL